jgi:hypothetical protein
MAGAKCCLSRQYCLLKQVKLLSYSATTHVAKTTLLDERCCVREGFPSSFLSMRRVQWLLEPLLDATRPMDAMALSFELPAEDEIATAGLSGARASIVLPLRGDRRSAVAGSHLLFATLVLMLFKKVKMMCLCIICCQHAEDQPCHKMTVLVHAIPGGCKPSTIDKSLRRICQPAWQAVCRRTCRWPS